MLKHEATSLGVPADGESGDVNAVGGKELGIGREVDGGDGVDFAVAAAGGGGAFDAKGPAEEGAGVAQVARGGDELADAAGGDRGAAEGAWGVDGDAEAEFAAEGFEAGGTGDAGLGVVAEAEVFALVDFGDVEGVDEDAGDEVAGMQVAELVGEGKDEGGVDAGVGEELELAGERGEKCEWCFGAEDAGGVRIEGDGEGKAAEKAGAFDHLGNDALVAEVHAVEVADGGDHGGGGGGEVGELGVGDQRQWLVVSG